MTGVCFVIHIIGILVGIACLLTGIKDRGKSPLWILLIYWGLVLIVGCLFSLVIPLFPETFSNIEKFMNTEIY